MISTPPGLAHSALLYSSTEGYLAAVTAFVRAGLSAHEPVVVAAPRTSLDLLCEALQSEADRIRLVNMNGVGRNPGRIIPEVLCAFADEHPAERVRAVTEAVWLDRTRDEVNACMEHEALVNLALPDRRISILCPHTREIFTPERLGQVEATHPVLIDDSGEHLSVDYAPHEVVLAHRSGAFPEPATAFTMHFTLASFTAVRHTAVAHARRCGLPERRLYAVAVAASELATNSIKYGGGGGVMRVWTENGIVVYEFSDRGWITDPLVGRRTVAPSELSGRGLLMVNMMTDLLQIRSEQGRTTVRFHMVIGHDGPQGDE